MYHIITFVFSSLFFLFTTFTVFAQTPTCAIIYGGGEIQCAATISADMTITTTPTPLITNSEQTTKGGLPVYQPSPNTQSPSTGPEVLGFIGLIPAAAVGFYLRHKTK